MILKPTILMCSLLISVSAFADLNKPYKMSIGENLARCVERNISFIDRAYIPSIRSYTKFDKHYIALNTNSIYTAYIPKIDNISLVYINNEHVENTTQIENAKNKLMNINKSLFVPAINMCKKQLQISQEIKFTMMYMDPAHKSRKAKNVIVMNEKGNFILP